MVANSSELAEVLALYDIRLRSSTRSSTGLINATWFIESESHERFVLQRLHAAISPAVNERIERLGKYLEQRNICSPALIRSRDGASSVEINQSNWRLLSHIEGRSFDVTPDNSVAAEAGRILGLFHAALTDVDALGSLPLSQVHRIDVHIANLRHALNMHCDHKQVELIATLADEIFRVAQNLPAIDHSPPRIVHGDPKLSNILFDAQDQAVCLVDLDTLALMPLELELGDAFRSWCNPVGEDSIDTKFSLQLFDAALGAYARSARNFISTAQSASIVVATETIYVELAARFCADALNDNYFGWDPAHFESRCEHNLVRAKGQLNAAKSLAEQRADAHAIVERAFGDV